MSILEHAEVHFAAFCLANDRRIARMLSRSKVAKTRHFADGCELPTSVLLARGAAAVMLGHPSGQAAAVEILVPPAWIEPGVESSIVALGGAEVESPSTPFDQSTPSNPSEAKRRLQVRLRETWLSMLLFEPAEARIAFLLMLLRRAHEPAQVIPVRLTNPRIAQLCGVAVRTVDRALASWVRDGRLVRTRRGYRLDDDRALHLAVEPVLGLSSSYMGNWPSLR